MSEPRPVAVTGLSILTALGRGPEAQLTGTRAFTGTPMSHFYEGDTPIHALRLSCSAVTPVQIDAALNRLAALIADQLP